MLIAPVQKMFIFTVELRPGLLRIIRISVRLEQAIGLVLPYIPLIINAIMFLQCVLVSLLVNSLYLLIEGSIELNQTRSFILIKSELADLK